MQKKYKIRTDRTFVKLVILTGAFLLLGYTPASAQQDTAYVFHHLDQSDGLLHTHVRGIVQDSKGYIWILTTNGLQRYDGSRFVNYPYELNSINGITDTRSADLFADKKKNYLWITNYELEKLDLGKNKFTSYKAEKIIQDSSFKFESYFDSSGKAWLLGEFGLFSYGNKKIVSGFITAPSLAPGKSGAFCTDIQNEETWVVSWDGGLSLFKKKDKKNYTYNYNPFHHPLLEAMKGKKLWSILKDSEQNIWIGSFDQFFYRYNTVSKKLSTYSLAAIKKSKLPNSTNSAVCFFEDNHHTLWIGTENAGLLRYNRKTDSFKSIFNEETNDHSLKYNYYINNIFQDRDENIWLGTDNGVSVFNPYRQYFQPIHHEENNPLSLPKSEIEHFIQTANKDILVSTWGGGLTVYDSTWNFKKNINFSGHFEYNLIWSLIQHDNGNIWAGCQHGYIHIYAPLTRKAINTLHPPELGNSTIRCMAKDRKGNIWMGLHNGKIAKWDKKQNKFYAYNDSIKGIAQTYTPVLYIFFDNKQRCWVSTENGFKQFDTEKRIYQAVYLPDKNIPGSISANICNGIEQFSNTLVIGTMHGGLNFFNPDTKTFTHLTTKNGLPSNTIHAIKKDASGYLWFTTDYSLYKFKFSDKKFTLLNLGRTINTEFITPSFYPLQDGRWLTATTTEIICFRPERIYYPNTEPAKVEITGFRVFDAPLFIDPMLTANQAVKLNYKQNFLTVDFSLLNFSVLQQTKYYYRLSGVDKDWINAGTKNFAGYTNLQPGEYVFSVKADNDINSNTSFKIVISPPFWERWWFITLLALLFLAIISGLYRYRINQVFKLVQIRQRIASDLHDDIGSALSSISIFSEVADKQLQQQLAQERTREVIGHISHQSRAMLEAMDDIVWAVNPKNDHFNDLAVRMREFAIPLLEARNISFEIDINADMQHIRIHMEARKNIFLIFKECINNIIKHSGCTQIQVSVKRLNNQLEFMVSDNGKGFDINQQSNRNGLCNMQKRATEMKGILQVTTQPGSGTMIKLLVNII